MVIFISKGKKKKDLHRRESSQKTRITNRLQRNDAFTKETSKTLKQLDLSEKKFKPFIENLTVEGLLKSETNEGITRYWLNADKIRPKEKNNSIYIAIIVFIVTFVIIMVIFFPF